MGKYLDIARKLDAQRNEQESLPCALEPRQSIATPAQRKPHNTARSFLPRPLGKEHEEDFWNVWDSLFTWLIAHHPFVFQSILAAEDVLQHLEHAGVMEGPSYEAACTELRQRFEHGRRLKMQAESKVWLQ